MRLFASLAALFALIASPAFAQTAPAQPAAPDPQNIWVLQLSTGGPVTIALRPDKAPKTVERIKALTRQGFYNGLLFHRVIEGFMAQGGDPSGTGEGGSPLPDLEAEFNDMPHVRGVVSMARTSEPNSANSQFFVMLMPRFSLDNNYTAFGRVTSGMQYVDAIERGEPPAAPTRIVQAYVQADGPSVLPLAPAAPAAVAAPVPAPEPAQQ